MVKEVYGHVNTSARAGLTTRLNRNKNANRVGLGLCFL